MTPLEQMRLELAGAAVLRVQERLSDDDTEALLTRIMDDLRASGEGLLLIWRQAMLTAVLAEELAGAWGLETQQVLVQLSGDSGGEET